MGLSHFEMDRKMDEHFGFEARDDIDGVVSTLAPDAVHDIVGWPSGPTLGRENARPFYETLFRDLAEGKVTCTRRLYGENFLVDDSVWHGTAPGRPFGLEGKG
ncbi:MAG: nuclear transport factor 2 family protein, partial [Candidatus Hydrogenedentes bacterium]|nr:nuclear transport factor 2 family protein [Candidatus Hydrogenedentota bacterium]